MKEGKIGEWKGDGGTMAGRWKGCRTAGDGFALVLWFHNARVKPLRRLNGF